MRVVAMRASTVFTNFLLSKKHRHAMCAEPMMFFSSQYPDNLQVFTPLASPTLTPQYMLPNTVTIITTTGQWLPTINTILQQTMFVDVFVHLYTNIYFHLEVKWKPI